MDILVSDTNVFIDLWNCGLLEELFRLPYAVHTLDTVVAELKNVSQKECVESFRDAGKLFVKELDERELVISLEYFRGCSSNLSLTDCMVICYTRTLDDARLLTGDMKMRRHAEGENLTVSGILFLFDEFVKQGILSKERGIEKLHLLEQSNPRLPEKKIVELIEKWRAK